MTLYHPHLEHFLVDIWQQQDEQIERPDLLLQALDVGYAGKRWQVFLSQQRHRQFPRKAVTQTVETGIEGQISHHDHFSGWTWYDYQQFDGTQQLQSLLVDTECMHY